MTDDLGPLSGRDDGLDALHLPQHLIADDTGDEDVAVLLGVTKKVEMPDVKQVESTHGIADARPHDLPRSVFPQRRIPIRPATPTAASRHSSRSSFPHA